MTDTPFVQRAPWLGGHLQTVRNLLRRESASLSMWQAERLTFATLDASGDRLTGALNRAVGERSGILAVIIHGLTGCEDSAYVLAVADCLLRRGHDALRMNLRGAGPSRASCRENYHAARTDDLRAVFAQIPGDVGGAGIATVGFSLGGNLLLKYLAEEGARAVPFAAASVSAPIDLSRAADRFDRPGNWPYRRWLLNRMGHEVLSSAGLTERERAQMRNLHSIRAFDQVFTAPRNGFRDAKDYYSRCSALPSLGDITVPTMMVHAGDDPWVPMAPYKEVDWRNNECLVPHLLDRGGHVGFHGRGSRVPWYATEFLSFIEPRAGPAPHIRQAMALAASTAK